MASQIDASESLLDYVRQVSLRDDEILRELRTTTARLPAGQAMQVMAEEGQLLGLLVALTAARTVLEIGTYTGYSTLCMARALPVGGRLITCDITNRWSPISVDHWKRAGVADRIDLRLGDAAEMIPSLLAELGPGGVDFAFIDADKRNYRTYYEGALELLRPGGLIVLDNTLFFGRVADPEATDPDTVAIRELNQMLKDDSRVEISLLVMADGITLARKIH